MVTQAQIARKLGVSRQLVTFALSGYPQIAEESRERILAAAREMGYRPNPMAAALGQMRFTTKARAVTAELAWINCRGR